jgi:tRNA dimethylallyltransferase
MTGNIKVLIAIVGPTASGKSDLAIHLAQKYDGEIICADSRTFYKGLNIGTAKPYLNLKFKIKDTKFGPVYQIEGIPHYALDIVSPDETFTAAQFQKMAYQIIDDILTRDKIPFLVGGTGLYVDVVTKGFSIPHTPPNPALRDKLERMSNKTLTDELKKLDADAAKKIDPNNKRRLIRALEVCLTTGLPFSKLQKKKKPPYKILTLGIDMPRDKLYERINKRVDKMIEMGLVAEARGLFKKGYSLDLPSMSGLGYKQIGEWLVYRQPKSLCEAIYQIKRDTRRFARRQISWFKRDKSIVWVKNQKEAERVVDRFLH